MFNNTHTVIVSEKDFAKLRAYKEGGFTHVMVSENNGNMVISVSNHLVDKLVEAIQAAK